MLWSIGCQLGGVLKVEKDEKLTLQLPHPLQDPAQLPEQQVLQSQPPIFVVGVEVW